MKMLARGPEEVTQIKHGIATTNAQFMPEEATAIRENPFHLNNCGLWHFPLKWLLVGWRSGRWRICWGNTHPESYKWRRTSRRSSAWTSIRLSRSPHKVLYRGSSFGSKYSIWCQSLSLSEAEFLLWCAFLWLLSLVYNLSCDNMSMRAGSVLCMLCVCSMVSKGRACDLGWANQCFPNSDHRPGLECDWHLINQGQWSPFLLLKLGQKELLDADLRTLRVRWQARGCIQREEPTDRSQGVGADARHRMPN